MALKDERPANPDYIIVLQVEQGAAEAWEALQEVSSDSLASLIVAAIKAGARLLKINKADITDMEE